jgi:bacillithiol system protein YtxJ
VIKNCEARRDFDQLLQNSQELPVFLLKHSTRCPISGFAWRAYQRFAEEEPSAELWQVLVIENAELSSAISRETGIRHESPQVLLFHKGDVVWSDSYYSIKEDALRKALDDVPTN